MLCTTGLSGSAPSLRMRMSVSCLHSAASASGARAPSGIVTSSSGIFGLASWVWVADCNLVATRGLSTRARRQTVPMPASEESELLERESELAAVDAALGRATQGSGSVVVVEGAAGIGKTRLLRAARARAQRRGMLALRASGGELERGFALGVVHQLLDKLVASMAGPARVTVFAGAAALSAPL